ncbi:hypothetical protein [Geothrix sp. 21YS21S-4]|uniref:hypothetical protein n=1 Tax=Geothrix sp. 21YS21S-4 TaxID=3068889 RepID=UPI0027B8A4F0|nr:hypothetical protein [Geothrix sp. 21YS21S-4]
MLDGMEPLEPWIPPVVPDLAALAMQAADEAGAASLRSWPQVEKGGVGFENLPPFLCWRGRDESGWHLVLLQPRELGALIPGARTASLPPNWLAKLDLDALARPLALHPDFPGGASVHVVHVPEPGRADVRTFGKPAPDLVAGVLTRTTHLSTWNLAD